MSAILAAHAWPTNAHLIEDVAALGHLRAEWSTLDPTYGLGVFWKRWRPEALTCHDLDPAEAPHGPADFRALPYRADAFDAVVFDPPYKLNGTPSDAEERYGTHKATRWQDRMALIERGVQECARVVKPGGYLLVKCQDQVCSGKVRWQTDLVTNALELYGWEKVDRMDLLSYRPQPAGTSQVHARRNSSQLLVFRAGTETVTRSSSHDDPGVRKNR